MEYQDLLEKANDCDDPVLRMIYVTTFIMAGYTNTKGRLYKPFNPLLGETYEIKNKSFNFIAE
jgi:hypothetical protein